MWYATYLTNGCGVSESISASPGRGHRVPLHVLSFLRSTFASEWLVLAGSFLYIMCMQQHREAVLCVFLHAL